MSSEQQKWNWKSDDPVQCVLTIVLVLIIAFGVLTLAGVIPPINIVAEIFGPSEGPP